MAKNDKLVGLNKELLIWRGFTQHGRIWTYPDGVDVEGRVPCFPESFDECLKWLAPRLWICNITLEELLFWNVEVSIPDYHGPNKHGDGQALDENLAIAFCLAIQKLIRSEQC